MIMNQEIPATHPALRVEVITLFPRMIDGPLAESVLGKAQQRGLLRVRSRDLRPYGTGKHQITDDTPYGGGAGMVMKPEPIVAAIEEARSTLARESLANPPHVILLDPQGAPFNQAAARRLSGHSALIFVCGRYEGVDERVRRYVDESLSVGDFVLTGGEFATLCIIDAVARLLPGVLGNELSATSESFAEGLLEGPQYTRPVEFRGDRVPEVLLSGDHARIARWRLREALDRTRKVRPDALKAAFLGPEATKALRELQSEPRQCIGAPPEAVPGGIVGASTSPADGTPDARPGESRSDGVNDAQAGD
jgi:tRNA (guanine37-N1)-methyltransferase